MLQPSILPVSKNKHLKGILASNQQTLQKENMKKIINRNNCKVSYCCKDNVKLLISHHNKKILSKACNKNNQEISTCNCRNKNSCPPNGKCLQENAVYKATITY